MGVLGSKLDPFSGCTDGKGLALNEWPTVLVQDSEQVANKTKLFFLPDAVIRNTLEQGTDIRQFTAF
ncbi:hypothetical protein PCANC_07096 [Puccinia coronata f. sp. avenae]|uniref:Uncharacterized protein n=1 Tax=Puccinia coronata f. sp. avenae TaxID=200324 RepID=A0A2N5UJ63_9BASI|nr:hypothetical protein PCASD_11309 [Puccinia coronata f. sp. avenae]PLW49885.1 hypothetical protein PCANC_07096 [Puccinia coronata f. sp. avenae]